ncbi:hypothetical protein V2J52_15085 [Georgenia sp. MJ173]|uniref:hypothetical protein n=1 Tax=Georgenia sunbinii TaxID=3117728 RepID=UPI002F26C6A6
MVVAVVAVAGLGVWWLAMAGCVALTCGWMLSLPIADEQRPRQVWPVALLLLVVGTLTAFGPAVTGTTGFVVDAYSRISLGAMAEVSLATAVGAVAVATFLMASGNLVARATLGRAHLEDAHTVNYAVGQRRRFVGLLERSFGRAVGTPAGAGTTAVPSGESGHALRGGRWIGPLERLLIVVLATGGADGIIAALLAAKGIVRFPEISADRESGSKAEEFLVGSLTSWGMAAASVVYLKVLHAS